MPYEVDSCPYICQFLRPCHLPCSWIFPHISLYFSETTISPVCDMEESVLERYEFHHTSPLPHSWIFPHMEESVLERYEFHHASPLPCSLISTYFTRFLGNHNFSRNLYRRECIGELRISQNFSEIAIFQRNYQKPYMYISRDFSEIIISPVSGIEEKVMKSRPSPLPCSSIFPHISKSMPFCSQNVCIACLPSRQLVAFKEPGL